MSAEPQQDVLPGLSSQGPPRRVTVICPPVRVDQPQQLEPATIEAALWQGPVEGLLANLPREPTFDLVVTSPPYNLGKRYERRTALLEYLACYEGS